MSALAGIWNYDGKPVDDEQVDRLADASRLDGPDGTTTVRPLPGLALQTNRLAFDRLSAEERQPHPFGRGSVVSWDGRLDNREDLLLVLHRDLGAEISDAALVAAAYARWNTDCLKRLVGDWSLAIWDADRRRMVLARDYMGTRPLYYLEIPGGFAWASCLDALASCFDLHSRPDETYICGKLTRGVPPGVTPFEGVRRVQAGHWVSATGANPLAIQRYWFFEPSTLRYRDQETYIDHFRSVLHEAVQKRLRANRTVWADLSGGWDSSSIVCLAHALIRRGQVEAPAVQPVSGVYRLSPEADDSGFIDIVERWCGLTSIRREWDSLDVQFSQLAGIRRPFPQLRSRALYEPLRQSGDRVVLTGIMGDVVMMQSEFQRVSVLEPLHDGHPLRWLRVALDLSRQTRRPLWTALVYPAVYGHLSNRGLRTFQALRHRKTRRYETGVATRQNQFCGVTPAVFERAREVPDGAHLDPSVEGFRPVKRVLVRRLYATGRVEENFFSDTPGVLQTSPFLHRPLIDFVLAVPQLALWAPAFPRLGMKEALKDVLPPELLARPAKHSERIAELRDARRWSADLVDLEGETDTSSQWELVRRGYVEPAALANVLRTLRTRDDPPGFFRKWFFLEAWLRTLRGVTNHSPDRQTSTVRRHETVETFSHQYRASAQKT